MMVALSPKGAVDLDTPIDDLGRAWRLESVGIHVKQYPFGNIAQRAIDGVLDLVTTHDVGPQDVVKAEMLISDAQYAVVSKSPSVTKFVPSHSIGLAAAAAILERRATSVELGSGFYSQPRVQELMKRVVMVADSKIPADTAPNLGFSGGVRLHLADGRALESPSVDYARGHWTRRMSENELWKKFSACSAEALDAKKAERLFHDLMQLERVENVAHLNA
jgi:2-methylcitrate dehydratase PrpD